MVGEVSEALTHAAVSVLNAIPTGVGAALGIDLKLRVRIKLVSDDFVGGSSRVRGVEEPLSTSVLKAVLSVVREVTGYDGGFIAEVNSEIPVGVGLKSSSALTNALIKACLSALGTEVNLIELATLGVKASLRAGITITGAYDDSLATLGSGVYVTNNELLKVLKHIPVSNDLVAVILVPKGRRNLISEVSPEVFKPFRKLYELAIKEVLSGEWFLGATLNGLLTANALGTDLSPITKVLGLNDVLATGVTGKGPAIFALTREPKEVINLWRDLRSYYVLTAKVLKGDCS